MQRHPSELPVGFSNAHIAGGGQTFSWVCFTLSLSHELKHKQLSVFGILLCAFFFSSSCFWSFIIPRSTSPLTQRESPDRKFYPAANRGGKKIICSFSGWSLRGRLWLEMEGRRAEADPQWRRIAAACEGRKGQRKREEMESRVAPISRNTAWP